MPTISGAILAGGNSTRMGQNKALLSIDGKTSIEHVLHSMQNVFAKNILIANIPHLYSSLGIEVYPDLYRGLGPLAGLHAALSYAQTDFVFLTACDLPLLTSDLIADIVKRSITEPENQIILPKLNNKFLFLAACYHYSLLPEIESKLLKAFRLSSNVPGLKSLLTTSKISIIDLDKLIGRNTPDLLCNMNTPTDYYRIKEYFHSVTVAAL